MSVTDRVSRWRALPDAVKTKLRRDAVVDQVSSSMAMEGEPVSKEWEEGAHLHRPPRDATVLLNDDLEWSRGKRAAHAVHASLALHGIKYRHAVRVLNAKPRDITGVHALPRLRECYRLQAVGESGSGRTVLFTDVPLNRVQSRVTRSSRVVGTRPQNLGSPVVCTQFGEPLTSAA